MLHLVGYTLFANKSVTHIGVVFLDAFRDLNQSGGFSLGAVVLVHMYENQNYVCKNKAKHLTGYITLLRVIILIFIIVICFLTLSVLLTFSYSFLLFN